MHEEHSGEEKASSDSSGVSSLDAKDSPMQPSPPPIPNSKKKKAPAPPPPAIQREKPIHRTAPSPPITNCHIQQQFAIDSSTEEIDVLVENESSQRDIDKKVDRIEPQEDADPIELASDDPLLSLDQTVEGSNVECRSNDESSTLTKNPPLVQKEFTISTYCSTTEKDPLIPDNMAFPKSVAAETLAKDPVLLLHQSTVKKSSLESPNLTTKQPSLLANEFTISTYSSTAKKDPIIPDNATISKDSLMKKDYLSPENSHTAKDQIQQKDHVILQDQVLKQAVDRKLDLPLSRESEGQHRMTVAAKAVPAPNVSTGELFHSLCF